MDTKRSQQGSFRLWLRNGADLFLGRAVLRFVLRSTNAVVVTGPFAGMKYVKASIGSSFIPKLLGSYEKELHGVWERWKTRPLSRVVDVGAAEGYYAVGLALMFPAAKVTAFETEESGRRLMDELARRNGIQSQITIRGRCDVKDLAQALDGERAVLLVCD